MTEIINIDEYLPIWSHLSVKCVHCGARWVAVYMVGTPELECYKCLKMTPAIEAPPDNIIKLEPKK